MPEELHSFFTLLTLFLERSERIRGNSLRERLFHCTITSSPPESIFVSDRRLSCTENDRKFSRTWLILSQRINLKCLQRKILSKTSTPLQCLPTVIVYTGLVLYFVKRVFMNIFSEKYSCPGKNNFFCSSSLEDLMPRNQIMDQSDMRWP